MKKVKMLLIGILCVFLGCDKNNDGSDDGGGNGNNKLKTGQIEIKVEPNSDKKVTFNATAKKITIDWGDGNSDELTPNGIKRDFIHEYTDQNLKTILINTESLTDISIKYDNKKNGTYRELWFGDCPELEKIDCPYNELTALEIKGCKALTNLDCSDNQLTSLDVSSCAALTRLDCSRNKLTASALNALFNSLPQTTDGSIFIYSNPGASECDRAIAENKGWPRYLLSDDICVLCSQNQTHTIGDQSFRASSIITPNADGINDLFTIYGNISLNNSSIIIYYRNKNEVYSNMMSGYAWDGRTSEGSPVESGLFSYDLTINGIKFSGIFIVANEFDDYIDVSIDKIECSKNCLLQYSFTDPTLLFYGK